MTGTPAPPPAFRGAFRTDPVARAVYAEAAGISRCIPMAVAVPNDADDVSALVAWAHARGVALVPRGSGTSLAGGAVGPGVIVDLGRLRSIGAVDQSTRTVRVGAGAICGRVDAAARAVGLRVPAPPSSAAFCSIGGMAATNAAGAHSLLHGATRQWVRAVSAVFDDGSLTEVRRGKRPPSVVAAIDRFQQLAGALRDEERAAPSRSHLRKDSSGYAMSAWARSGDVVDLLVGSEGTLALLVEVELVLIPVPGATSSLLGAFPSVQHAVAAAGRARELGAAACELLDRTFLDVAAESTTMAPRGAACVLLVEVEADDASTAAALGRDIARAFHEEGARDMTLALDADGARRLWDLRHAANPVLARLDPSLRSMQFIEDGAVPPDRLGEYVAGVRSALERQEMRGIIFGHAADGHVHVNPLVDLRRPDWRSRVEALLDEVTALVAQLGGTVAGEHGDGRLRTPLLPRTWDAAHLRRFQQVKSAFDPTGILNPGVKLALPGQRAIEDVKYDDQLPPLPDRAREVIDTVDRMRAYDQLRLDLLDGA